MGLLGRIRRFFFLFPWVPFPLGVLILPFLPALSAGVYLSLGPNWSLFLGLPAAVIVILFSGGGSGWIWLLQWVAMGPIFVETFARARTLERAMAGALLATLALQAVLLCIRSLEGGISPWAWLLENTRRAVTGTIQVYGAMGMDPHTVAQLQKETSSLTRAVASIVPGLVITMDLLIYWWTLLVHRRILALGDIQWPGARALHEWGMPYPWVWMTISGGILVLVPGTLARVIGINVLMVMGMLHLLQGIGVIATLFQQRRVPPFFRGLLYALIFLQQFLLFGIMMIGLFDLWFDFRKRWSTRVVI